MHSLIIPVLLAAATVTKVTACTLPTDTLSNSITTGFGLLIQNPAYPVIHDRYFNLLIAGGGDKHLFLSPVGDPAFDLVLDNGSLEQGIIHAIIGGEYSDVDNTTKMFMSERNEPLAIFQPTYGCDPDTDEVQIQLAFVTWQQAPVGGNICVRIASGDRGYEFRYSPPGNPAFDPTNPCMAVTMVVVAGPTTFPTTSSSAPTSTSSGGGGGGISTTTSSAPTGGPSDPATVGAWSYYGCQTEATNTRALSGPAFASDTMTLEGCAAFCSGYNYFGTEWSRECYCGNSFNAGSVVAPATDCSYTCSGNALQLCGAGLRLSVYTVNLNVVSSSTTSQSLTDTTTAPTVTASTSTSSTSTTSSSAISSTPLPFTDLTSSGFAFLGCAPEERRATDGPGRVLTGTVLGDDTMTNEKCIAFCTSQSYAYAGTEWTRECWCGNSVAPGRVPQTTVASLAGCNFKCGGDATEYCGGDAWLSLYQACGTGPCVNVQFT